MNESARRARERIIAAQILKLERRQALERARRTPGTKTLRVNVARSRVSRLYSTPHPRQATLAADG
jgi:hypothetical protein